MIIPVSVCNKWLREKRWDEIAYHIRGMYPDITPEQAKELRFIDEEGKDVTDDTIAIIRLGKVNDYKSKNVAL